MRILYTGILAALACFAMIGCAGTYKSNFVYSEAYRFLEPVKDESCYDAAVLLNKNLGDAKDIALKTLAVYDGLIQEERDDYIKATRRPRIGFMVGSGGETIVIEFKHIDSGGTFVTIATKTHFGGGAGMKPWSCEMADQMVKFASK